jgi:phosphoribosylglycinamide formyltransferase-1
MINLHPSLLPLYPGLETYRRAIDAGDRQHGASVHFLTDRLDGGPVISRVRVPIRPDDDSESLRRRLAPEEHRLIVATVELFQGHRVERGEDRVVVDGSAIEAPLLLGKDGTLHVQRGTQV